MFAPGASWARIEVVKLISANNPMTNIEGLARLGEVIKECIHEDDEESW